MGKSFQDKLRILLVNAIDYRSEVEIRYPNLGLGYLVASVRQALPDVNIEFCIADRNIHDVVQTFRPHLAGITSVSQNFPIAKTYLKLLSDQNVATILGGVHISALPHLLPSEAAVACLGEGERTFVELVGKFLNNDMTPEGLSSTPGIAFWNNGKIQSTASRGPIADLDTLPMPARDLLKVKSHTYMFTSRGCPYRCIFCSSSRYWESTRFFSAEYVTNEIEFIYRTYKASTIRFFDDLFIAKKSRLEQIIRLMEKRNLLGKVQFTCNCRANLIDNEMVGLLSRLGVVSTGFGLESGDEETLSYLKCGNVSIAHNQRAVDLVKKAGIAANASFVIGSPKETAESIMKTYSFIRNSKLDFFDVYILTPFPGTPVWDYAKERGLVNEDNFDWARLNVNVYREPDKAILLSEILSKDEIIILYKKFKRLRRTRGLLRIWRHPLLNELPRYAWSRVSEFCVDRLRKVLGQK